VNYAYDKVGNFLKKTDYSANTANAYRYGGSASCAAGNNAGPNAVCQLTKLNNTTVNFQYDNRGNLRVGDGLTMTYNAMDKPLTITGRGPGNSTVTGFVYGSDGMRAKQTRSVSGVNTTTYYVDKYYEVDSDGSWRAYLDDIAVLSYTPARQHLLHFTLRDRLGSATTMADQNGNLISQRYFDPFGRTASTGGGHGSDMVNKNSLLSQLQDLDITNKNRRGFTDHEHLNEQQLIHMNGRVYDYNLGRFMSVDPLIQSPTSTQSVNPYSYIMNNPLAGTDPTGYAADYLAGVGFGFGSNLTDGQVNLLNQAESCSFCSGEFAAGVNFSSDFKASYKATGSLLASAFFIAKSALPSSGADSSIKADSGKTSDIGSQKELASNVSPQQRGRESEERVLKDMGMKKNKRKVSSSEGNSVPDAITDSHFVDVKDTKKVSDTKQMRIQRDAAKAEGKGHMVLAGEHSKVSKSMARKSTIVRRSDLGPKQSQSVQGVVRISGRLDSLELKKLDKLDK
jgi:RHS repeat-associated protein